MALNERINSELKSLTPSDNSHISPFHPPPEVSTWATITMLKVTTGCKGKVSRPRQITSGVNEICQSSLHDHSPSILLPWPTQVCWDLEPDREEFSLWDNPGVVDNQSCGLTLVSSAMCSHCVLLVVQRLPDDDQTVLDNCGRVTKDEIHSAWNHTVAVELSVCLNVQCVLVRIHPAVVDDCHVWLDTESHSLVSFWTSSVGESHWLGNEPLSNCSCIMHMQNNKVQMSITYTVHTSFFLTKIVTRITILQISELHNFFFNL